MSDVYDRYGITEDEIVEIGFYQQANFREMKEADWEPSYVAVLRQIEHENKKWYWQLYWVGYDCLSGFRRGVEYASGAIRDWWRGYVWPNRPTLRRLAQPLGKPGRDPLER